MCTVDELCFCFNKKNIIELKFVHDVYIIKQNKQSQIHPSSFKHQKGSHFREDDSALPLYYSMSIGIQEQEWKAAGLPA